jgi:hypothetical protein
MEMSGGCQYNPINGDARSPMELRQSEVYQPGSESPIGVYGDVFAGAPIVRSGRGSPGGKRTFQKEVTILGTIPENQVNKFQ